MTISWESTYERFKAAQNAHTWATPSRAIQYVFYLIVFPVAALCGLLILLRSAISGNHLGEVEFVTIFALIGAAIGGWTDRTLKMRKFYRNCWPSKVTTRTNSITLSEEGLYAETPGIGRTQLEWNLFCRFLERKNVILLYFSKTRWLGIPQEVLTPEQRTELIQLLENHIGREQNSC